MDAAKKVPYVILVADDEPMVRKVAVAMLEGQGYTVLTADDGHEALKIIREYPSIVDLVLCDIRMPGPSGVELRNLIFKEWPETSVAVMSGDTSSAEVPSNVPCLSKPFTVGELRERLRELLRLG
jgi:two-component system cell cycle sensor histidine kinase/response regulator CckA